MLQLPGQRWRETTVNPHHHRGTEAGHGADPSPVVARMGPAAAEAGIGQDPDPRNPPNPTPAGRLSRQSTGQGAEGTNPGPTRLALLHQQDL